MENHPSVIGFGQRLHVLGSRDRAQDRRSVGLYGDVFTPDDAMSVEWARVNEDRNTFNADDDVRSIGDWRKNWRLGNYE